MRTLWYSAARGSGKTAANVRLISPFVTIDMLKRHNKALIWIAFITSLIAIIASVRCLMYNWSINDIKRENEAKNAQIERLESELSRYNEK